MLHLPMKGNDFMKMDSLKMTLSENENAAFPNIYELPANGKEHLTPHTTEVLTKKAMSYDTQLHGHAQTHKPRQLPGRHH